MRFPLSSLLLVFSIACGSSNSDATTPGDPEDETQQGPYLTDDEGPTLNDCYEADSWTCDVEAEIARLTNLKRPSPLNQSFESSFVARTWSAEQAAVGTISHTGFPAARNSVLRDEFPNAAWGFRAENVAMFGGYDSSDPLLVAERFVEMWYNSEGHKTNMLGNYRFIGVGVSRKGNAVYATQLFH